MSYNKTEVKLRNIVEEITSQIKNPLREIKPHNNYDVDIKTEFDISHKKEKEVTISSILKPNNIDVLLGAIK